MFSCFSSNILNNHYIYCRYNLGMVKLFKLSKFYEVICLLIIKILNCKQFYFKKKVVRGTLCHINNYGKAISILINKYIL